MCYYQLKFPDGLLIFPLTGGATVPQLRAVAPSAPPLVPLLHLNKQGSENNAYLPGSRRAGN